MMSYTTDQIFLPTGCLSELCLPYVVPMIMLVERKSEVLSSTSDMESFSLSWGKCVVLCFCFLTICIIELILKMQLRVHFHRNFLTCGSFRSDGLNQKMAWVNCVCWVLSRYSFVSMPLVIWARGSLYDFWPGHFFTQFGTFFTGMRYVFQ